MIAYWLMRTRLYAHLVWTTRDREPVLDAGVARWLCRFFRAMARKERCEIVAVGMVRTHVHLLVRLHPTASVSALAKRLKGASSTVAKRAGYSASGRRLYWAKGYFAHTVGTRQLAVVEAYLRLQPNRHPHEAISGWDGDLIAIQPPADPDPGA